MTKARPLAALLLLISLLPLIRASHADVVPAAPPKGQRVFVAGHSFHVPIATPLSQIAKSAGIADHKPVGPQMIGGSTVTQHWNLPDDKNKAKAALTAGEVDVLTLSPHFNVPDDAIDKFADLLLSKNPNGRMTVQVSWIPRDGALLDRTFTNDKRDQADLASLRKVNAAYADKCREQVKSINDRYVEKLKHPVAFVVPTGEAVTLLRERVAKGQVPGIARQSELFTDPLGHGTAVLYVLNAYCHYAVIYGKNPAGLPVPDALNRVKLGDNAPAVNKALQEIAWEAVTAEPASGVVAGK